MTETRKCIKCGDEYEPEYYDVLNTKILRGAGNCPKCATKLAEEEHARDKTLREQEINNIRQDRIATCGIPPKFVVESFTSFDKGWQDKALAYCKKYADEFPIDKRPIDYPSLYLWSAKTWGVGKTHLSCAIALSIFERWTGEDKACPRIYFASEPDLFRQIQGTYNYTREEEQRDTEYKIIKRLLECDLLILDDVGKEPRRDMHFVRRILFSIINGRYDKELPIILTANLTPSKLKSHIDEPPTEASFDRFFEMIRGKSVCMDGDSYRRKK